MGLTPAPTEEAAPERDALGRFLPGHRNVNRVRKKGSQRYDKRAARKIVERLVEEEKGQDPVTVLFLIANGRDDLLHRCDKAVGVPERAFAAKELMKYLYPARGQLRGETEDDAQPPFQFNVQVIAPEHMSVDVKDMG